MHVLRLLLCLVLVVLSTPLPAAANSPARSFGVLNQRSEALTARYWKPILTYISNKSGVRLELKMGKTAMDSFRMAGNGEFDYLYSYHIFAPANLKAGYRVFARPAEIAVQGQIVVPAESRISSLHELQGKKVGFPNTAAFLGYAVPMQALQQKEITVEAVFSGSQEETISQLKAGLITAAGVNSMVMRDYAAREKFQYRVIWSSECYQNLPIAAHPRISEREMKAVQKAFLNMVADPKGLKILRQSAEVLQQKPPFGFVLAEQQEYRNYLEYYRTAAAQNIR